MHAHLRGSNNLLTLYQIIEADYLSLADEIAEPCPDMKIKVTAITVAQKLYYMTKSGMREYQGK